MLSYRYVIKVLSQNKRNVLVRCRCLSTSSPNFNEKILFQFSNSRSIKLSTGKLARMADGCAVVASGDTNVMATVVSKNKQSVGAGFVPLTVEYRQKAAAAGRIPTHHLRREIGSTEKEILTSRIIDRSIRPLFPKNFTCETQVTCNLLSLDSQNDPDVLAINAASTALALSDVPWNGPIGAVCVALDSNYECITNPTRKERTEAKLNVIIAANETGNIYMMEAFANEPIHEQHLIKCVSKAIRETKIINQSIIKLQKNHGKPKRSLESIAKPEEKHLEAIRMLAKARIQNVFADHSHDKFSRDRVLQEIRVDTLTSLNEEFPGESTILNDAFTIIVKRIYAEYVTETGSRCDGRKIDELRPISCEVDLFRPVHGSALFQRGQTQVLCTATLDSLDSTWRADSISAITQGIREKNFMLHYEFPQYAVNEIGKSSIGRRDIGHGALAERALRPVVPVDNNFTIRLLCEVLESNGSSSMASVSAGSLALYDSGIKISSPVTGIAIGLIEYNDTNILLTDISGFEDFYGEMDFKIAGTKKAFTALQLDCKLENGLSFKLLYEAIQKSNAARNQILNIMNDVIDEPRLKSKENMPLYERIEIPLNKRSKFLGHGWSNAKRAMSEIGITITQDVEDINAFNIFAPNQSAMDEFKEWTQKILSEPNVPELEFGAIYHCKVIEIKDNGVMIQIHPSMHPVFLHISQLDIRKVDHPSALSIEEGSTIPVKYFGRDPVSGQIRISRKVLQALESKVKDYIN
ncbi:Polyribonucleotide nucleotidyltransferase 1 [Sarcoptes scabiei]|uniref:polyribonucleotide nucleotidyltransferase n=2 Tax=Sarcoptes scabiei TaxID=52283 RepID=A0A834R689_SARSC|nr:Polyribonucleotide nucleotidyltransferase 1 [Sarcoptes scabiei]